MPDHVDGWVTLVFGKGAVLGTLNADTVTLAAPDGTIMDIEVDHTRWLGDADAITRLLVLKPRSQLEENTQYTVTLHPGVELVDGQVLEEPWTYIIRTDCDSPEAMACQPPSAPDRAENTGGCRIQRGPSNPWGLINLMVLMLWARLRRTSESTISRTD